MEKNDYEQIDIKALKENHKTAYLAGELERLDKEEKDTGTLIAGDPAMAELAKDELAHIKMQKEAIAEQIRAILKGDEEEEQFPSEVILEVRAGAGGDEASLFAHELANMILTLFSLSRYFLIPLKDFITLSSFSCPSISKIK